MSDPRAIYGTPGPGAERHRTRVKAEQLAAGLKQWVGDDLNRYERAVKALRPLLFNREHQEVQRRTLSRYPQENGDTAPTPVEPSPGPLDWPETCQPKRAP